MRDHVHLVMGKPDFSVERLVIQLKGSATEQLIREGIHPLARYASKDGRVPKCWVRGQWKVFLAPTDVTRAIQYVKDNPVKAGFQKQEWSFVGPYEK